MSLGTRGWLAAFSLVAIPVLAASSSTEVVRPESPSPPKMDPLPANYTSLDTAQLEAVEASLVWEAEQARQAEEARKAEEARVAEETRLAAEAVRRQITIPPAPSFTPNQGGHSDAWWQGVAVCEQGGRNDPYFGFFSFMDGSQGGKPWADQVAAGNALLARAGREIGPWAASCVAAGYRASPAG
jgi:hypothetical protein